MATRNISLTDHFDHYIDEAIATGRYQNASEVVRDGLRLHEERERAYQAKVEALRAALQVAEDDIANGRFDVIESEAELRAYMDTIRQEVESEYAQQKVAAPASASHNTT